MKRVGIYAINAVLALFILFVIVATWMPAIYTSESFQRNPWVRKHLLDEPAAPRPR